MDRNQQRFMAKLKQLDRSVSEGLRRQADRDLDALESMARAHRNPKIREEMSAMVDGQRLRVEAMPAAPDRAARPSKSIRAVRGGRPTLGKRRR